MQHPVGVVGGHLNAEKQLKRKPGEEKVFYFIFLHLILRNRSTELRSASLRLQRDLPDRDSHPVKTESDSKTL